MGAISWPIQHYHVDRSCALVPYWYFSSRFHCMNFNTHNAHLRMLATHADEIPTQIQ